jgi:hypothetical protein
MKRQPQSHVVLAALAGGVLYFVLDLSSADRGLVDYVVIGLVVAAVLWNIVQLSRRLYRIEGRRTLWRVQRTVLLWVVGILNTALLRPEDVGGWRSWLGWTILLMAAIDTLALYLLERQSQRGSAEGRTPPDGDHPRPSRPPEPRA